MSDAESVVIDWVNGLPTKMTDLAGALSEDAVYMDCDTFSGIMPNQTYAKVREGAYPNWVLHPAKCDAHSGRAFFRHAPVQRKKD